MKKVLAFLLILSSCGGVEVVEEASIIIPSSTTTTSSSTASTASTPSTVPIDPLLVTSYVEVPDAIVRIVVKKTQAELGENLKIEIYEYDGTGSGFFISNDGYIVTNNHVISGAVTIEVYTNYRSAPYAGKLIGLSECDDLAVLKIDINDARYLNLSKSNPILGQEIIAAGFPRGDEEITFLNGIVSKITF